MGHRICWRRDETAGQVQMVGVHSGVLGFTECGHLNGATLQAALEIISSVASGEEARLQAFEALSSLLEPVDNANGELLSHSATHGPMALCTLPCPPALTSEVRI